VSRAPATIEFLGGARTVTGSKFLVEAGGTRTLVECGLYQGLKELRLRNWQPCPVDPRSIERVVLTHAHVDHSGYLPRLIDDGFRGPVWATRASADLLGILLPDSGRLHEEEAADHNRYGTSTHTPALPLYTEAQGRTAADAVHGLGYGAPVDLAPGVRATFARAGHILGAAIVALDVDGGGGRRRIVFSGDLGRHGRPILPDPAPLGDADYVVVESTYGDRRHDPTPIGDQLERVITAALARGGAIVVPAFAVGRTQELMYHLDRLERAGRIPAIPTYVDSPLAIDATDIYAAHPEDFEGEMRTMILNRMGPFRSGRFRFTRTASASRTINDLTGPVLIIAASGMATGGRVLHHLRRRLPDPRTTVLLVGYQALGTRGHRLERGATTLRIFGEDVPVRAAVETIHGLSAHADSDGLMRWLGTATRPPRHVLVVHGDPAPAEALAARVRGELGWPASVPAYRDRVELG
jgi:metallo-beta-lactamase family protein